MVDPDGGLGDEADEIDVLQVPQGVLVHVPGDHQVAAFLQLLVQLGEVDSLHLTLLFNNFLK